MNLLDYSIVAVYLAFFLWLGTRFSSNETGKDYFLGGKTFGWGALSLSTIATQLSAISFISAPAFVGLKEGGGMVWLTYEFAVPLAMLFLMAILIPKLYEAKIVSVYAYLEKRFGRSTRVLLSTIFQISRAFGTSVMIYAVALILTSVMDIPLWQTILGIGAVTLLYSLQGGMKAVVYGDVIQMIVLMIGIVVCLIFGLYYLGGWDIFVANVDPERLKAVNFDSLGLEQGDEFGFWPMLIGGFFLYASYYGTDQSQVQRLFSAPDRSTLNKVLLSNGLLRFPITMVYCIMGLVLGTLVLQDDSFRAAIPFDKPDLMVPVFIRDYLPHGLIGLLIVAIFSAAMSSMSSAVNSLSAAAVEDFFHSRKPLSDRKYILYSKGAALFWGIVCIVLAFFTGDIAKTVIEAINKIGSVFYGPILATFVAAILIKRIHGRAANLGILAGVLVNVYLWLWVPSVFWFWWNAVGAVVTLGVGYLASYLIPAKPKTVGSDVVVGADAGADEVEGAMKGTEVAISSVLLLVGFFVLIVLISVYFPKFF